jgi:hypothetical protein
MSGASKPKKKRSAKKTAPVPVAGAVVLEEVIVQTPAGPVLEEIAVVEPLIPATYAMPTTMSYAMPAAMTYAMPSTYAPAGTATYAVAPTVASAYAVPSYAPVQYAQAPVQYAPAASVL